jgi:hypothetical protein
MTWKQENCKGTLALLNGDESRSFDINFSVECRMDGVIDLQVNPISLGDSFFWLLDLFISQGLHLPRFLLTGETPDGILLRSDRIYLTGFNHDFGKADETSSVRLWCDEFLASCPEPYTIKGETTKGLIRYDLPGFLCFGTVRGVSEVGEVRAAGATGIEDYDIISGALTITNEVLSQNIITDWINNAREQADLVLDIFSLAGDRYLEWVRKSLYVGDQWIETNFRRLTRRGKSNQPIFQYLNMQPVLDLAISNYTEEIKQNTGFGSALEQFLMPSVYIESQFLTSFMALEQFVNNYSITTRQHTIIGKSDFEQYVIPEIHEGLRRAKDALKNHPKQNAAQKGLSKAFKAMKGKVGELNRYPFITSMWRFFSETGVPLHDLPRDEVEKMVMTRHALIHSGSSTRETSGTPETYRDLPLLREILTRTFLTLLKYEGQYSSYLQGHQHKTFPPSKG